MKHRGFVFMTGFAFGLAAGTLLSQESVRVPLTSAIVSAASTVDQQIRRLIEKASGSPRTDAENTPGAKPTPIPPKPALPVKADYIREFIQLTSVQAKMTSAGGNVAVVSGRVKNSGEWDLSRVSATVYFMSEADIVFDTSLPIVGGAPLEAGTEIRFEVNVPNVPGRWAGGRIRPVVTDIEFTGGELRNPSAPSAEP